MPKKPKASKGSSKISKVENTEANISNGLEGALFGGSVPGAYPGFPGSASVSQVGNIFNNLRWYFISNFRQPLSEAYVEMGLIQTVVNVPVDDGFRGGVTIVSKQLSPDQIKQLSIVMDREGDIDKVGIGRKWTRLFGGGGVIINTDQDYAMPLDIASIGPNTPIDFIPVDMWELIADGNNTNGYNPLLQSEEFDYYSFNSLKVHRSRVVKMVGMQAPSFLRPKLRGWGFSVVESIVRSINQYLEGTSLLYELIGEAKIDVYGIKNLTNTLLSPNGTQNVAKRIMIANQQKDYQHALVMDSEDKYTQKQLTFSGMAEVMNQVRYQVASELRMPISKLFGIGSSGFSSGEDDIEVYNAMIESTIRQPAKKDILEIVEIRCQQLFQFIPDDLSIEFQPLRVMSSEQEEKVKLDKFSRLLQSLQAGAISLEEFRTACNKDNLLEISLDNEGLDASASEITGEPAGSEETKEDGSEEEKPPKA